MTVIVRQGAPVILRPVGGISGPPGPPGAGSNIGVKEEGTLVSSTVERLNFKGNIAVTGSGADLDIEVPFSSGESHPTRSAMATAGDSASNLDAVYLAESGREGTFVFYTAVAFATRYGGETLTARVAADTLQGVYVAAASDATGASGAWVREDDVLTPFMFGAQTNYKTGNRTTMSPAYGESSTPGSTNGILVDSRAACQAMINLIVAHENRAFVGDFRGGLWGITSTDGTANTDGLLFDVPGEYARRFIGGAFRGIGPGRNLIYVDELARSTLVGFWHVAGLPDLGGPYAYSARTWENGLWIRNSSQSNWAFIQTQWFKRWGVIFDPEFDALDYNNNIGLGIERIYSVSCGANGTAAGGSGFEINWTASARTGSSGAAAQRTDLTLAAGHEILRVGDIVKMPSGDFHVIREKVGAVVSLYPWTISTASTGTLTSAHGGGVKVEGKDVAGLQIRNITGINCGVSLDIQNVLHGCHFGEVILEGSTIGLVCGTPDGIGGLGHTIDHIHSEAVQRDIIALASTDVGISIGSAGAFANQDYSDVFKLCEVLSANNGTVKETAVALPQISLIAGATEIQTGSGYGYTGTVTKSRAFQPALSNSPASNRLVKVMSSDWAVSLKYYESVDRNAKNHFKAYLEATGENGRAPAHAITVTLDAADVTAGIQFLNGTTASTYVIAAGAATGPVALEFWLDTNGATLRWIVVEKSGIEGAVTTQTGTSYTAALTDANDYIRFTNAAAVSFTIPPNSTVPFPIGTVIEIEQAGAGALSVVAGSGVTINPSADLTLAGQYSVAALKKVATDTWTLVGAL